MIDSYIAALTAYAEKYLMLDKRDETYARNRLMEILGREDFRGGEAVEVPALPDGILAGIFACLEGEGREVDRAVLGERLMDAVMLRPSEFEREFFRRYRESPEAATGWAHDYAVKSDYVKKSAIEKNIKWGAENGLEITINLSKPEKNNKDLLRQIAVASTSYPKCTICRENEGYEKRGFSRRNMRTVSLTLAGEDWFWQYSPYAYFNEHGIAVSAEHAPMKLDEKTAVRLFDFVDLFPHYFIGNNAPLPRVGGSILMHDHFQGGRAVLPMQRAAVRMPLFMKGFRGSVGLLDWYNTALRFEGDRREIERAAYDVARAWSEFSCPEADILPFTGETPHSTASMIARRGGKGYILDMILRNNRQSEEHPDGIFHAHRQYHAVKSESIGLIEAMGLFILPARLVRQLSDVKERLVRGEVGSFGEDMALFAPMTQRLLKKHGKCGQREAEQILKLEIEETCRNILDNTAVFKRNERGERALGAFLRAAGLQKEEK